MSFTFPSAWRAQHYDGYQQLSTLSNLIVYLSTQRLPAPCLILRLGTRCGPPTVVLPPGGVLVSWTANAQARFSLGAVGGKRTRIGGLPARMIVSRRGGPCTFVGELTGDSERITAYISDDKSHENWLQMEACLRGPNLAASAAQVRAMLRSVSFSPAAG